MQETRRLCELEDQMKRIYPMVFTHQERLDNRLIQALETPPARSGLNKWDLVLIAAALGLLIASYFID